MTPLLELQGISAGYGHQLVIRDVSLRLEEGQFAALIGPNGHGKTTLLRTISGLIRIRGGSIGLAGRRIDTMRPDEVVAQPLRLQGALVIGDVHIPNQNLLILGVAVAMMAIIAFLLNRTRIGRAIRATAQNRDAAQLMGIRIGRVYAQVLALSGALAALSGVMISSLSSLLPNMGGDPMLKAFVICVVAGLGNVYGAVTAAIVLGLLEAAIQFVFGVQYSFAILLVLVIAVLIWRPAGLFGRSQVVRL